MHLFQRSIWEDWISDTGEFVRHALPKLLVVIAIAIVLIRLLRMLTGRLARYGHDQSVPSLARAQQLRTMASVINSVGAAVIAFLALMQVLPLLGINMGPLLASAGIAGLAIGFGAQTLVKDVINGFLILLENQYALGDTVRLAGVSGTVEAMTLRRTVLRDTDGTVHVIPNSEVKIVSNLTRDWTQVSLHVAAAYSENSERIVALLKEVAQEICNDPKFNEALVAQPEVPGIERVAAGEVDYLVLARTRPGQQYAVSRELRRRIKEAFEKNNVQAPAPARVFVADPSQRTA